MAHALQPGPPRRWPVGPSFWVACGLSLALAVGLAFVPLFDLLGYEFSAAIGLLVSMTAGPVAIGVVRRRRGASLPRIWGLALAANLACLALPLLVILLNALRVPNCNLTDGLLFYLLLPVATAVIAGGWGVALGLVLRRRWWAGLAYAGLWIGLAAWNLWEVWRGPQVDSYNQLIGWVAGPIYDEVVEPGWPLVFCRLQGLAGSLALVALAGLLVRPEAGRPRPGRAAARRRTWALLVLAGMLCLGLWSFSSRLGFDRSPASMQRALGGLTRSDHFLIHHDRDLSAEDARLLASDHEFRLYQIERMLGEQTLPRIRSWVFPNARLKRELTGAGRTQYARPWNAELAINGAEFPHPTLKHELVHVVAGAFGAWPFRVSARWGLWINPGLTEGIAVAVAWPANQFDPHIWSAAMRRIGKAPPIEQLFSPVGFWSAASGRSYTLAGSFVRYLLTRYGAGPLRAAYRDGQLAGHYPEDATALIAAWQRFLDGLELGPGTLEVARLRFSVESVFHRVCAHEMAALRQQAARQLASGDPQAADRTVQRFLSYLPGDTQALEFLIEVRLQQDRQQEALAIAERLLARDDLGRASKARLAGRMGDLMVRLDKPERARALYQRQLTAHLSDGSDRTALIKLQALDHGPAGRRVLAFLERGRVDALGMLDLTEAVAEQPDWAAAAYLVGRQLFNLGHFGRAAGYLWRAARNGLGAPVLAAENLRLLAICSYRLAQPGPPGARPFAPPRPEPTRALARSAVLWAILAQFPRNSGELLDARDWFDRIYFDRTVPLHIRPVQPALSKPTN